MFLIHLTEENGGGKTLAWNPATGLFGGIDHAVPALPDTVTEFCRAYVEGKRRESVFSLRISLGDACNLHCAYCIQSGRKEHETGSVPVEELCDAMAYFFERSGKEKLAVGCMGGCPALPEELFELNCLQNTMLGQALFGAFLKTLYPAMRDFRVEYVGDGVC